MACDDLCGLFKELKEKPYLDHGQESDSENGVACPMPQCTQSTEIDMTLSLNRKLLYDIVQSDRCRFKQREKKNDTALVVLAAGGWSSLMQCYAITDLRFRNTHDRISRQFRHGPHAGLLVDDLVQGSMCDLEKPEALTPLVAATWCGELYIICSNRRLWSSLKQVPRT